MFGLIIIPWFPKLIKNYPGAKSMEKMGKESYKRMVTQSALNLLRMSQPKTGVTTSLASREI